MNLCLFCGLLESRFWTHHKKFHTFECRSLIHQTCKLWIFCDSKFGRFQTYIYMPSLYWTNQYNNWQSGQQTPWMTYPTTGYKAYSLTPCVSNILQHEAHMAKNFQPTRNLAESFNTMILAEPSPTWYMESGDSSHLTSRPCILHYAFNLNIGNSLIVRNGTIF